MEHFKYFMQFLRQVGYIDKIRNNQLAIQLDTIVNGIRVFTLKP